MPTPAPPPLLNGAQVDSLTDYVLAQTRYCIENFGQRPPGSEGERRALGHVASELEHLVDGPVTIEPFPVAQKAFMMLPRIASVFVIIAVGLWWVHGIAALACSLLAVAILVMQLGLYWQVLDPFFPKKTSHNLCAVQQPSGEKRRRIILNGHPDAAYEWRWLYNFPRIFPLFILLSFGGLLLVLLLNLAYVILAGGNHLWTATLSEVVPVVPEPTIWFYLGLAQLALLPTALISFFYTDFKHVSYGANDNLSGTFIAAGVAKALREAGVRLQHTELMVLITGSEEAGLRGAKAWAAKHKRETEDVETIFVALDTFRDLDHLKVYNRDLNGFCKHDEAVCTLLQQAGRDCGRELPYGTVTLGSSDATAFTQAGIRAGALAAMDPAPADYYHNRRDHWENMDRGCIRAVTEVVLAAVARYDAEGLGS